jgi:hypothetical protein
MVRRILVLSLLALSVAVPGSYAQTAPAAAPAATPPAAAPAATPPSTANAVDPAAVQALKDMGAYLLTLKRYEVSAAVTGERVLADGQKLQHSAAAELDVVRPNKIRVLMKTAGSERQLTYDGKTIALYTPAQKYYGTLPFDGTVGALIDLLETKYGMQIPLDDLFRFGTPEASFDTIESAMFAGQDRIGKDLTNHYAFRQGNLDWQIWISAGSKPLPRKFTITNRADEARPQSVHLIDWNLNPAFKDAVFKFTPPKEATKIPIVERKTK